MTVASEIQKLQTNLSNSYSACEEKGATLPAQQNFDNLSATISSIETGGGSADTVFGLTATDIWYSFPNENTVFDENAPHLDLSNYSSNTYQSFDYFFAGSRIKSINTPYPNAQKTYKYQYVAGGNQCVQYVKVNMKNVVMAQYCVYAPTDRSRNVKVIIIDSDYTTMLNTYNSYLFGNVGSTNSKVRSIRFEKMKYIRGNFAANYICGNHNNLQTAWFPDLEGISSNNNGYNNVQNALANCREAIGFFMPRLKQIGYSSAYGNLKNLVTTASPLFDYVYFPALEKIVNSSATTSNATFYGSSGMNKIYLPAFNSAIGDCFFNGCGGLTEIHFGKENQATIEAMSGYSTLWGRGAGNATVYFDLINKIVVNGKTYQRTQYNDYMTQLTYNDKVYYRDDSLRDAHNEEWQFWAWESDEGAIVYTQNPLSLPTECVWEYISGDNWDYNQIGDLTANDWRYAWTNVDDETDIIYTTNQWTPAVGDQTYTVSADGKSFNTNATITEVI